MSLFQNIRNLFGRKTTVEDSPIEALDKLVKEREELNVELNKAQNEFDEYSSDLELKISACEKIIEKGEDQNTIFNKSVFTEKLEKITDESIEKIASISKSIQNKQLEISNSETDILKKSIEITASLSEEDQKELSILLKTWDITGIIKGEQYDSQLHAIVAAIEEITIIKSHAMVSEEPLGKARILTIPEEPEDLESHYSNMIVKNDEGKILFLKRANDKVIAPGKYCLPGGHIDKGESIEEAGLRELKEEAGLIAKYAWIQAKAKCENGKWAFYLTCSPENYDVMLLDGESINAAWMSEDEWLQADLLFDLKDHLRAMQCDYRTKVKDIPEIKKAEEALSEGEEDTLIKGKKAEIGEKRNWSGLEYVKTNHGWIKTKDNDKENKKSKDKEFKHSTDQLVSHAENTSSDQLKKIAADESKDQHLRDAAKREIERRDEKNKNIVKKKTKK